MPEFILDHGTPEAARAFQQLDAFTQGYITAMFFTDASDPDDGDLAGATFAELAPETLAKIKADCVAFQAECGNDLVRVGNTGLHDGFVEEPAGRDFWYTRNGHGCGFWDGDWPEPYAAALTKAAEQFGTVDIYRGDDGLIYC